MSKFVQIVKAKYFKPKSWGFWRSLVVSFCICCIVGHWLEMFYCFCMDSMFGIVEDDYVVLTDPWFHPYWVYGFGAVFMSLAFEPLKEKIIRDCKTSWGAVLETFVITVFLSMFMELAFGLMFNQPDATGEYPYWDNSQLPLNILGQAWLVNDVFIGLAATLYLWIFYPLICSFVSHFGEKTANIIFVVVVLGFGICCLVSYLQLQLWLK